MRTTDLQDREHRQREYLSELPKSVPSGRILVHNLVEPAPLAANSQFRAWFEPEWIDPDSVEDWYVTAGAEPLEECGCSWVEDLGLHYRPMPWLRPTEQSKRYGDELHGHEIESIYVDDGEESRFIVSLVVGYADRDYISPERAARSVLAFTRDEGSHGTRWCVFDRQTQEFHTFKQWEIEGEPATST
jgi:hypothetical protein